VTGNCRGENAEGNNDGSQPLGVRLSFRTQIIVAPFFFLKAEKGDLLYSSCPPWEEEK
jgi:hypothetical protein